jgi:hypothetical protein
MKLSEHRIRWSALVAILIGAATGAQAYDDDHVQSHVQPFLGAYVGMYQQNTDDLNKILPNKKNDFLPIVPNGGITLGAAYDRFHAGFGIGYQMISSNDLSAAEQASNSSYVPVYKVGKYSRCADTSKACTYWDGTTSGIAAYKSFSYDMIPIEAFAEMTLFKNAAAVNFLVGGSAGVGLVSLTQPISAFTYQVGDTIKTFNGNGGKNGADKEALFLYSGYVGLRINIAERLNLQGQIGWRGAFTDKIYFSDCDCYEYASIVQNAAIDPKTTEITSLTDANQRAYRLDLSGAFVRADLRWTFASQAEKDIDRATTRRNEILGGMRTSALRGR